MKPNEAPKKIYLEREKETDRIHHLWGRTPVVSSFYEHIEYSRTDSFIEKACEWLRNNSHNYASSALGKEYLVNDFKNYLKGE